MSTKPSADRENPPLSVVDSKREPVLALLLERIESLTERVAELDGRSTIGQVEQQQKVLQALHAACDESAARLEWFNAAGRTTVELLNALREDAPTTERAPSLADALSSAVSNSGGTSAPRERAKKASPPSVDTPPAPQAPAASPAPSGAADAAELTEILKTITASVSGLKT